MSRAEQRRRNSLEVLRLLINYVPARDESFVGSLLAQYDATGALMPNQWVWVGKLVNRAVQAAPEAEVRAAFKAVGPDPDGVPEDLA